MEQKHATGDSFVRLHIGQWINKETSGINNPGGFLFQADLEKSNNVSENLSSNNQGEFSSWWTLKKIRL